MIIPAESIWLFNAVVLVSLLLLTIIFTWIHVSPAKPAKASQRYITFGVTSFIAVGALLISYVVFLAVVWGETGAAYHWPIFIRDTEYDLANGFFTVLVGAAAGLFATLFAYLRFKEAKGHG
jgi:hypothetical protein